MTTAEQFIKQAEGKVLVAGYGSLLNHYSRFTFSQIDCIALPAIIQGWQRAWITRSISENQTYVGATPNTNARLNAHLIALEFDDSFEKREQDYKFTALSPETILLARPEFTLHKGLTSLLEKQPVYICETLDVQPSDANYPVNFSYILTCLQGCFEMDGAAGVASFLDLTQEWRDAIVVDDLVNPKYPRPTVLNDFTITDRYQHLKSFLDAI
jgi:hypothetical protein